MAEKAQKREYRACKIRDTRKAATRPYCQAAIEKASRRIEECPGRIGILFTLFTGQQHFLAGTDWHALIDSMVRVGLFKKGVLRRVSRIIFERAMAYTDETVVTIFEDREEIV